MAVGKEVPVEYAGTPMAVSRQAVFEARIQANQQASLGNNDNLSSAQRLRAMLISPAEKSAPKIVPETPPSNGNRNPASSSNSNPRG